ncbi:hypothetical protein RYX36_023006 [Vicia faba]
MDRSNTLIVLITDVIPPGQRRRIAVIGSGNKQRECGPGALVSALPGPPPRQEACAPRRQPGWTGLRWALFGKPGKGGISGPGLKMDLNANIGLTFTPIEWGNEQKHILSAIPQGKSVFITGSAGTGNKTVEYSRDHKKGKSTVASKRARIPPKPVQGCIPKEASIAIGNPSSID